MEIKMHKKSLRYLFYIFSVPLMLINLNTQAIYYTIEVLEKDGVKVHLLGDLHRDFDDEKRTNQQRNDVVKIAKQLNAFCFFEDQWHYEGKNRAIINSIKLDISLRNKVLRKLQPSGTVDRVPRSPCIGICYKCSKNNIPFKNIEFRHYNHIASGTEKESINNALTTALANKYQAIPELTQIWKDSQASISSDMKLFDLSLIYEFYNEWKQGKRNNFLVGTGALHTEALSQVLQNKFQFKKVLEKTMATTEQLKAIEQNSRPIKNADVEQMYIDLPKFFDPLLNQPHSKL